MSDDNPYRSPETHGAIERPLRKSWRNLLWWPDAPGVLAAIVGILLLTVAIVGAIAIAFAASPGRRFISAIQVGGIYGVWSLVWFAAAQNWWKGNVWSALVWTGLGLAPIVVLVVTIVR